MNEWKFIKEEHMISYNNHKFFEREDNDDDERAKNIGPSKHKRAEENNGNP